MAGINQELLQAYQNTTYRTVVEPIFEIRVGEMNDSLSEFMHERGYDNWSFITAENPLSRQLNPVENKTRNAALKNLIEQASLFYLEGRGVPDDGQWSPENSFLVFDAGKETSLRWSHEFQQKAFVYGSVGRKARLIFTEVEL